VSGVAASVIVGVELWIDVVVSFGLLKQVNTNPNLTFTISQAHTKLCMDADAEYRQQLPQ
jgi:hypothetical protein